MRIILGLLLVLLWAFALLSGRETALGEPDLQWHIKTGEWMWQNMAVPTSDPFSHSFAGQPWIAKEWLSQLILFGAYSALGWNGVMLLALLAMGVGAWALYAGLAQSLAPIPAGLLCITGLILASASFTVRPHLLTLPIIIIWTQQLFDASGRRAAPPFWLLALLVLWANLHAAFTLGFVIALFAFLDAVERMRLSQPRVLVTWLVFLALCPVVSLAHPYLWKSILATWTVVGPNEAVPLIHEWKAFSAPDDIVWQVGLLGLILLSLAFGLRLGIAKALLCVVLLHLFLTHVRYGYFFFPVLMIMAAPEIARQFPPIAATTWRKGPRDVIERAAGRVFRPAAALLAAGLLLIGVLQAFVLRAAPADGVRIGAALDYARRSGLTGHVMNHYNFGGALILHGIPTFIDGRTDQLFLDGFTKTFAFGPGTEAELAAALKTYDIAWTLFPPGDQRIALLDRLPGWRRGYADANAVIHLRERSRRRF